LRGENDERMGGEADRREEEEGRREEKLWRGDVIDYGRREVERTGRKRKRGQEGRGGEDRKEGDVRGEAVLQ
jgi:hypothetical protein